LLPTQAFTLTVSAASAPAKIEKAEKMRTERQGQKLSDPYTKREVVKENGAAK
jgi:hypothetical protein